MKGARYELTGKLWLWRGDGGWHFITFPKRESADIRRRFAGLTRGFGSLRVEATIGGSTWRTSIFPDAKRGAYLLPVKAAVRKAQRIEAGDTVRYAIAIAPEADATRARRGEVRRAGAARPRRPRPLPARRPRGSPSTARGSR